MKAIYIIFFLLFSFLIAVPTSAASPTPSSTTKSFSVQNEASPQAPKTATSSGTVQLIPNGDGQYQIVTVDPNGNYQISQAQFNPCDIGGISQACEAGSNIGGFISELAGDAWNGVQCAASPSCWIKKSSSLVQNALIKQLGGCEMEDDGCWEEQYDSVMNPNAPVKNAGAVMALANLTGNVASMQIPISTDLYLAYINPFKAEEAAADGLGDLTFEPGVAGGRNVIFDVWKKSRDAAYAFSIVILVLVGFMIMLRVRLDPKTAITFTSSLPKIVVMLVLITLSLAIAGLMIDAGRVIMQMGLSILPNVGFNDIGRLFLNTVWAITLPIILVALGITAFSGGLGVGAAVGILIFSALSVLIIFLVLLVGIFILCGIILFMLVMRYAKFLVSVMFMPLVMLALPLPKGPSMVFGFMKRQMAYILTIPITVILIELAYLVAGSCIPSPFSGGVAGGFAGVAGAAANPCGSGTINSGSFNPFGLFSMIAPFVGLGILMMATKAGNMADELMGLHRSGGHGGGLFGFFEEAGDVSKSLKELDSRRGQLGTGIRNIGGKWGGATSYPGGLFAGGLGSTLKRGGFGWIPGARNANPYPTGGPLIFSRGTTSGRGLFRSGTTPPSPAAMSPHADTLMGTYGFDQDISGLPTNDQTIIRERRAHEFLQNRVNSNVVNQVIRGSKRELVSKQATPFSVNAGRNLNAQQQQTFLDALDIRAQESRFRVNQFTYDSATGGVSGEIGHQYTGRNTPTAVRTPIGTRTDTRPTDAPVDPDAPDLE